MNRIICYWLSRIIYLYLYLFSFTNFLLLQFNTLQPEQTINCIGKWNFHQVHLIVNFSSWLDELKEVVCVGVYVGLHLTYVYEHINKCVLGIVSS